jgi:hypothetical protein
MPQSPDWKMPPAMARDGTPTSSDRKLGWLREAISEGETFLRMQRGYRDIDRAFDLISGYNTDERIPASLSGVNVNRVKRNLRELVATLSNLRPMWGYKNDNKQYDQQALILNRLVNAWWHNTFADRRIRGALQYAFGLGTGYVSPYWKRDMLVRGRGDIALDVLGPREVLPVQLPRDHDLQGAYAVIVRKETPIHAVHAMWPELADKIKPTRQSPLRHGESRAMRFLESGRRWLGMGGKRKEDEDTPFPMVDLYYTYVLDQDINMLDRSIPMGDPDTNMYYEVPPYGSMIPTGGYDPASGQPLMRKATREDAALYPRRRLLVATGDVEISDGPSPWWHGQVNVIPLWSDNWAWDFLGYSAARDGFSIQASNNSLLRAIDDSANVRMRPPLMYDEDQLSKSLMDAFDTRQPGQNMGTKLSMGKPIEPVLPPGYFDVPAWILEHIVKQEEREDHIMGVRDISAIAKARQIPSSDAIEKLMELAGPILTDMSRNMESSMRQLGEQAKSLFFQFYTAARRVQILGPDGVTEEDYDFEPSELTPSHMPGEDQTRPSALPLWRRAYWHQNNFRFHVTPNSLHQITQMTRKLLYLQLQRGGFPMDPWTIAEVMDIGNFGPPPDGTKNIIERWIAWMRMQSELQQDLGGGGQPGGKRPGRPPSGQQSPRLQVKEGGRRTTVREAR